MKLTPENKTFIDNLSYKSLLQRWREAPAGNEWFKGETGSYWTNRMKEEREKVGNDEHVRTSKEIGHGG